MEHKTKEVLQSSDVETQPAFAGMTLLFACNYHVQKSTQPPSTLLHIKKPLQQMSKRLQSNIYVVNLNDNYRTSFCTDPTFRIHGAFFKLGAISSLAATAEE